MADQIRAVKGMNDILPPDSARWEWVEERVRALMQRYGYANLRTPIVEPTALFVRGLGEVTDIVEKEMYSFEDSMNGDKLTLRPEATAGIVRAMVEHNALYNGPLRVWTSGAMFRHERPQKGRYRQFHQIDVEALGFAGPDVDAELILLTRALWRELGLVEGRDVKLELNSLGQPAEREQHRVALIAHFEAHADKLDEDAKRRLHSNPLRILDSKDPRDREILAGEFSDQPMPHMLDVLDDAGRKRFDEVLVGLTGLGIDHRVDHGLVRGLDYYTHTAFELHAEGLGAQSALGGGGRYDGLIEALGGPATPGIGFSIGLDRVMMVLEERGELPLEKQQSSYLAAMEGTRNQVPSMARA